MTSLAPGNYQNPLDNYRSYSYHYILTACSTTVAASNLLGNNKDGSSPLLDSVKGVMIGDELKVNGGKAYLIADTRRFSQYSITDFEMTHIYGTGNKVNPTVATSTLKMKLIDTTGLTFFNMMMDMMRNKIQSSQASVFYLMGIVFVGHKDDGTTEHISTSYMLMAMLSMGFEFQSSGSIYDITFNELEGLTDRGTQMEHVNYLGDIKTITTQNGPNTLGTAVDALERQLNVQSLDAYKKFVNDAAKTNKTNAVFGKLVQYMITIPTEWREFQLTNAAKSKNPETKFVKRGGSTAKAPPKALQTATPAAKPATNVAVVKTPAFSQFGFSTSTTITDALKGMLESCKQILDLASEDKRIAGTAVIYKTIISVTSDESTYVIHFDIYPFLVPKALTSEESKKLQAGSPVRKIIDRSEYLKNTITYDYFFTGKNSHIMDFKIQYSPTSNMFLNGDVDIGRNRFNANATAGQTVKGVDSVSEGNTDKTHDIAPLIRPGDPIFIPMKTIDQQKNNSSQNNAAVSPEESKEMLKSKQQFASTLAQIHFISALQADITVRGNPNLIKKWADRNERGGIAPHPAILASKDLASVITAAKPNTTASSIYDSTLQSGIASAKALYYSSYVKPRIDAVNKSQTSSDNLLNGVDVSTMPVFVKLNILAPNVDYTGNYLHNTNDKEPMFTEKFFYNGTYMVLYVTTSLSGGDFKHVMKLNPQDYDGEFTSSQDTSNTKNPSTK